jgi:hypothetical protein
LSVGFSVPRQRFLCAAQRFAHVPSSHIDILTFFALQRFLLRLHRRCRADSACSGSEFVLV